MKVREALKKLRKIYPDKWIYTIEYPSPTTDRAIIADGKYIAGIKGGIVDLTTIPEVDDH